MSDPDTNSQALANDNTAATCGVTIRREGSIVHLSLATGNNYLGIELYELLVGSAKNGRLHLDLAVAPSPTKG